MLYWNACISGTPTVPSRTQHTPTCPSSSTTSRSPPLAVALVPRLASGWVWGCAASEQARTWEPQQAKEAFFLGGRVHEQAVRAN
eukprot:6205456-Pleurochrysis_carterae.AAC.1